MARGTFAPGQPSRHHGPELVDDHLIVYAEPAAIRSQVNGRQIVRRVEDGLVSYRAVGLSGLAPHTITNSADTPSRHFIIELLGPIASDAPTEHQHNGRGRTEILT